MGSAEFPRVNNQSGTAVVNQASSCSVLDSLPTSFLSWRSGA